MVLAIMVLARMRIADINNRLALILRREKRSFDPWSHSGESGKEKIRHNYPKKYPKHLTTRQL